MKKNNNVSFNSIVKRNKIMVVDDDKIFLDELCETFALSGYDIIPVNKSINAFDTVLATKPDLILLDIKMEGLNGYQVIERLKKSPKTDSVPIIIMTGYLNDEMNSTLKDIYNIKICFKKPFNPLDVISQIEKLLEDKKNDKAS
jgi:CheY-like chemotaxis protein